MSKELGRRTRELFFARLGELAPDYRRCGTHDIKGFTWSFLRRRGALRQWLWFQRHKHDDAFTLELSWSRELDDPARPRFGTPNDAFVREGCRFRLGAFWTQGDFWWRVAPPPPALRGASPQEYVEALVQRQRVDVDAAMPRVRAAVDDAIARVREHALPYFDRVADWALEGDEGGARTEET